MTRLFSSRPAALLVCVAGSVCPWTAAAQFPAARLTGVAQAAFAVAERGELRGTILDEHDQPLADVVVSALGSTTAFAVSDRIGHFTLRDLPLGAYLVRAHRQGYVSARARIVQVEPESRDISIGLTRTQSSPESPQVLQAGVGGAGIVSGPSPGDAPVDDPSEVAWRLRHLRRSVLKDVDSAVAGVATDTRFFMEDPLTALARAVGGPLRFASDLIADLPLDGEINLFTRTSFDRPQDLFSQGGVPGRVAFFSLSAPIDKGEWNVRGGLTQGDLASWVVAGSSTWSTDGAVHRVNAGLSYAMQRYLGGNADALVAMADGRRNAGEIFAFDDWTISDRLGVTYGTRYARYDYLTHGSLLSPSASVTATPFADVSLRVRGTLAHRERAPGAEEFRAPATGMWLPPGRTFSPASPRLGFRPERIDRQEVSAEQPLGNDVQVAVRAFREQIGDQVVTLFGVSPPGTTGARVGHYYVGNVGDVDIRGWGVSLSRVVAEGLRASVDYTRSDAAWLRGSPGAADVALVSPSAVRRQFEQLHDLTTSVETALPWVDTRVFVVYKINSGFAAPNSTATRPQLGARFDVQVSQALPFLNFTSGQWEMTVAFRNLFHEELLDSSVYDELQVVRPPKHVVGGVTVRF